MQSVPVNTATSGDNALVAADPSGRAVVVFGFFLDAAGAVTAQWKSDTGGGATNLTGAMSMITGTPLSALPGSSIDPPELFRTARGKAFNLNLGGNVQVSGFVLIDLV
jgi:hypothetical protein